MKVGEPLVEDKKCLGRVFVSPGSGKIKEIIRGAKRRILSIVIEIDQKQTLFNKEKGSIDNLMEEGFSHIFWSFLVNELPIQKRNQKRSL